MRPEDRLPPEVVAARISEQPNTPPSLAALPLDQLQNVVLNGVCTMLEDAGAYLNGRSTGQHGITQFADIGERKIIITVDIE